MFADEQIPANFHNSVSVIETGTRAFQKQSQKAAGEDAALPQCDINALRQIINNPIDPSY